VFVVKEAHRLLAVPVMPYDLAIYSHPTVARDCHVFSEPLHSREDHVDRRNS
jgi:hypothetical protein